MGHWSCRVAAAVACVGLSAAAPPPARPLPIVPETLSWQSPPQLSGLRSAWMLGAEASPGAYVLRVKLAAGTKLPPHVHPDQRITTVLSGTLFVGFGEAFDPDQVVALPAGAIYVAPAGQAHFVWAKNQDVVYQESGSGPTGTEFIPR
jgi:quercetin dioxygenase-like cupin family protein